MKKKFWIVSSLVLTALFAVGVNRQHHSVSASENMPSLQGQPATDYLKKEGLFEKVKAAIEADRRELRRVKEEGVKGAGTVWEARHQGRNLRAMFTREGVRLTPVENCAGEKWQAAVSLKGVGYGEKLKRAVAGPMRVEGNRIELQKLIVDGVGEGQGAAITEWYVNKEQGIEQGFTLAERPGESGGAFVGAEPLRVVMSVSGGLRARVEDGGQAVALRYEKGSQVLRYDHLAAWDARGRWLPSHMEASGKGDEITLVVEDAGAVYPVTIDPLFTEVKKLIASDGAAGDRFGFSVSISGDTVVVGAPLVDSFRGAAYIYERNKGGMGLIADNWGEVKKLTASDGAANDFFGISVGISGDTVVVGAQDDDSGRGAAYVYERNKGGMGPAADNWGEVKKLTASDGAVNDRFGISVSISGDTVVVGAFGDDSKRGAAYIYERNKGAMGPEADNWGEVKKLTASDGAADDQFGNSVSISGDTVVVGAYFDDSLRGAAYIYERNKGGADNWGEVKKLTASDGAADDRLGISVGISGDTVVVGAVGDDSNRGAAYIYERNKGGMGPIADNWGEVRKLTASDGVAGDFFGVSVSISGDTVVVGAVGDDSARGAAYIYERNKGGMGPIADNWGEVKKLRASDGAADDRFGQMVSISGDTVVVGAAGDDSARGAAYTFVSECNLVEKQKRTASDGAADDAFGFSVSISGDTVVVGAQGDDSGRGAAYVYERNKGAMGPEADNWGEVRKLTASDRAVGDRFGWSVGISGDTVVAGAFGDDSNRGAAYIYERNKGGADNWGEVKKLTASDGAAGDLFGISVSISGDTVVVGAYGDDTFIGAAYIYERNKNGMAPAAENWGEVKKLTASDGTAAEFFGYSVGISGDTVVVAAIGDDSNRGAAYIYERNKGVMGPEAENWGEVKKLTASDRASEDRFGFSVSISGDTVVVGASGDDSNRGAAYIYERNKNGMAPTAENWGEVKKLTASDGASEDRFGWSVGISGDTVVVGAEGDDSNRGSAYIYERNKNGMAPAAENWGEVKKLTASDGAAGDLFGYSVGISGDTVVVGAYFDDSLRGSAYIFTCEEIAPNTPPTIAPMNATRTAGTAVSVSKIAEVSDAEDAENTLSVTAMLQSGMGVTITDISVDVLGNVTASIAAGCTATTSTFELKVTDSGELMAPAILTVTVNPNPLPVLSYTNKSLGVGKTALFYPSTGPSDNVGVTSLVLQSVTPSTGLSLSLNTSNGVITVLSASIAGTYIVEVVATDNCGAQRTATFNVTVTCPTTTLSTLANGQAGVAYNRTITVTPAGSYTFTVISGALPPGLVLDETTGAITGTPGATGTFNFTVRAAGTSGCSATRAYSLVISCPMVTVGPASLPAATQGVFYSQTVTVAPAGSYGFVLSFGSLPPGLALNAMTGEISGTPVLKGSYYVTVRASGFGACTGSRSYLLVVQ